MKIILKVIFLAVILCSTFGCAHNYYNIPQETYEKKIRIIGVAPLFVDSDSDIRYPEKEPLLALVRNQNRKNEQELVSILKDTGVYLSVRMPEAQADELFSSLFFRRERRRVRGCSASRPQAERARRRRLSALRVESSNGRPSPRPGTRRPLRPFL